MRVVATELGEWDTGLPAFFAGVVELGAERGFSVEQQGLPAPGVQRLITMAFAVPKQAGTGRPRPAGLDNGRRSPIVRTAGDAALPRRDHPLFRPAARGRARFRLSDLWWEIEEVGPRALVIVSVISFLVGLILAYLGADQLRMVGAQIFIADLVAIGMVREVGR